MLTRCVFNASGRQDFACPKVQCTSGDLQNGETHIELRNVWELIAALLSAFVS